MKLFYVYIFHIYVYIKTIFVLLQSNTKQNLLSVIENLSSNLIEVKISRYRTCRFKIPLAYYKLYEASHITAGHGINHGQKRNIPEDKTKNGAKTGPEACP